MSGLTGNISEAPLPYDPTGKPAMRTTRFLGEPEKIRKVVQIEHLSPPSRFIVHNSSIDNLERAVKERIFFVKKDGKFVSPPLPIGDHFANTLQPFLNRLRKHLPHAAPVERNQFADLYTGRKREMYAAAAASLYDRDLEEKDTYVKAFVKAEKIDKPDPVPRVIQPREKRYGVELGRYIKPIEKRICVAVNKTFNRETTTIFKGLNASESGREMSKKWNKFRRPVALGLDAKRFDQHVHCDALRVEHSIYVSCFNSKKHKKNLKKLLSYQLRTKGFGYCKDGKLKFHKEGGRCSGDMNTGLGNCILMCAMVHAYAETVGVEIELANNGDDCVVIMESDDLAKFSEGLDDWFTQMGFSMTVEDAVYELEKIEFCQTHPVFDGHDYVMVRNILSIAKDCISLVYNDTIESLYGYYRVLGDAGLHLTGGIPIWQNFYRKLCQSIPPGKRGHHLQHESGMMNLALRMNRNFGEPSAATRYSFYRAFGIEPDYQVALEQNYDNSEIGWNGLRSTYSTDYMTSFPL